MGDPRVFPFQPLSLCLPGPGLWEPGGHRQEVAGTPEALVGAVGSGVPPAGTSPKTGADWQAEAAAEWG